MVDAAGSDGPPTIYFADMGYASYNNFAHVIENGQFFLIRCNDKRLKGILGRPIEDIKEVDCHVDRILTKTQSQKKRTRPHLSDRYRFVCKACPMDYLDDFSKEYDISLRIVRFEIEPGSYENIITNLPDIEFDLEDFKDLYHMRWDELCEPCSYTNFSIRNALHMGIPAIESSYKIFSPVRKTLLFYPHHLAIREPRLVWHLSPGLQSHVTAPKNARYSDLPLFS